MKLQAIWLTGCLIAISAVTALATDFQIDKIVAEALAKAEAGHSTPQVSPTLKPGTSSVALSNTTPNDPPDKDAPAIEKTNLATDPQKEN